VAVATGDFNNDGHLDLATANAGENTVSVLLGNADGTFQSALTSDAGAYPHSLAVGDFNADGKLDLGMVNGYGYGSSVSAMLGNGNGSFQAPSDVNLDPNSKHTSVATGDFNEDGTMDLAVTSDFDPYYPGDPYLDYGGASVLLGIGDGSFSVPRTTTLFYTTNFVVVADFNGDDNLDLVVGTYSSNAIVKVMLGDGQGNLALQNSNWLFDHGRSMAAGDVDGDGDIDLVAANGFDVKVRMGNGVGGFESPPGGQSYTAGNGPISVVLGDFNDTKDAPSTKAILGLRSHKLVDTRPAERNGDNAPSANSTHQPRNVTWTYHFDKEDTYSRIDYILLSRGMAREWVPAQTYVLTIPNWGVGSDHRPIVATFEAGEK
jgi:hypothetical protein